MSDPRPSTGNPKSQSSSIDELARIFSQVAEAPKERRDAMLEELCSDENARQQVRLMLTADSAVDSLLDHSLYPNQVEVEVSKEKIAGYALQHELGYGGMGVVFQAEQLEPVRRTVAVKVVKPGVDTREVIARFNVERQALSLMDHPNIAKVLDAGSTESGRPFFVMELVKGQPITTYCEQKKLPIKDRLHLFMSVCQAIQHAHQKGIIHRDIKPSNVLVAEYDGRPVPKVIDFGVAKAINQSLNKLTAFTRVGQIVGTFEYMSPEQSRATQLDVDTRSDIYSLGVLLYELLAGSPPFDKDRLRSVSWEEMLRIIRDEDPTKPSARLAEAAHLSPNGDRYGSQQNIARMVRGELDWIVLKAMEKDRIRRYATPNELANDIECFLSGDPVAACPPSAMYRWSNFAKRNKVAFVTSALVCASLVLGLIGTTIFAIRESQAKAETAEINEFLKNRLFGLAGSEAEMSTGFSPDPDLRLLILLKNASDEVDKRFADRPEIRADLQATLARSFNRIGQFEDASRLYKEYLEYLKTNKGVKDPDTISVMRQLVKNYIDESRLDDAKKLCEEALQYSRELGEEHELTLQLLNDLATVYYKQGHYDKSLDTHRRCLAVKERALGDDHLDTLVTKSNLALVYETVQEYGKAEALYKEVLAANEQTRDFYKKLRIATASSNLGRCYLKTGNEFKAAGKTKRTARRERFEMAAKLLEDSWSVYRQTQGHYNPDTLEMQASLAQAHNELGRYDLAEPLLTDLVDRLERVPSTDELNKLAVKNMLGWTLMRQSRFAEAESILNATYEDLRHKRPADPLTIRVMGNLAIVYDFMGKFGESMLMDKKVLPLAEQVLGLDHFETLSSKARLGLGYLEEGRTVEGRALLEQVFENGKGFPGAFKIAGRLAYSFESESSSSEAYDWTTKQIESAERQLQVDSQRFADLLEECISMQLRINPDAEPPMLKRLISLLDELGMAQEAESWRKKTLSSSVHQP